MIIKHTMGIGNNKFNLTKYYFLWHCSKTKLAEDLLLFDLIIRSTKR